MKFNEVQTRTIEPYENDRLEDAIEIVKKETPMAWNLYYENGIEIWRGMKRRGGGVLTKGNSGVGRKSAYTSNHFNLILDWLPNWEHIPKRSKSWVCSTSRSTASGYGNVFLALPANDIEIAFCQHEDFWVSFQNTIAIYDLSSLADFNHKFGLLFTDSSSKEMIKQIKEFDKIGFRNYVDKNLDIDFHKMDIGVGGFRNNATAFFDDMIYKHGSIMKALEHLFDPNLNGITVHNFSELTYREVTPDVECWFEGPAHFLDTGHVGSGRSGKAIVDVLGLKEDDSSPGTFIGIRLSDKSNRQLEEWCHQHNLNCEDFHVTLILDDHKKIPHEPEDVSITLNPNTYELEMFDEVLVLRFDNRRISQNHYDLRTKYDISWDFDEYKPHITLDYNWNKEKPDFEPPDFPIELSHEYKTGFDK